MIGSSHLKSVDDPLHRLAESTYPGQPSWGGQGPSGSTCSDCVLWGHHWTERPAPSKSARCSWPEGQGLPLHNKGVPGTALSCRYFAAHPRPRRLPGAGSNGESDANAADDND